MRKLGWIAVMALGCGRSALPTDASTPDARPDVGNDAIAPPEKPDGRQPDAPPDVRPDRQGPEMGPPPDAPPPDAPPGPSYAFVVIYDRERIDCATTSSPGSDIDGIRLLRGGALVGVGLEGSALFGVGDTPCRDPECRGDSCRYACTASGAGCPLAANAEGPPDAIIYKSEFDTGYLALNSGSLQLEVGDPFGGGTPTAILPGDTVEVLEVDRTYAGDPAHDPDFVCLCIPERFEVFAFRANGVGKPDPTAYAKLVPAPPAPQNALMCEAMSPLPGEACGSTAFAVP